MTVEARDVPDSVLDALTESMPAVGTDEDAGWRESWRQALAAALTAWEGFQPRGLATAAYAAHECARTTLGVQHRDAILGVKQTDVLQRCEGCGDIRTVTLNGTWTMGQLRG